MDPTLDQNTINGVLRALIPAVLAYAVGKGWIPAGAVADITSAAVAIGAAIWSVLSNRKPASP